MGLGQSTSNKQSSRTPRDVSNGSQASQSGGSRDATVRNSSQGSVVSQRGSNPPATSSLMGSGNVSDAAASSSNSSRSRRKAPTFACTMPAIDSESESLVYAPRVPNTYIRMPKELWEDSALPMQTDEDTNVVMPVGFNNSERRLLLTLWHEIATNTKNLAIKFYVSLITLHPEFRHKFAGDTIAADAHIQSHAMAALRYLINLANYIDDEEAFNESINRAAEFHMRLTMTKEDILTFNNVFINMLIKELPDYMFPESAYALIMFLSTVTSRMYRHMMELKTGVKYREDGARPAFAIRRRMTSASEELYETITEWHIEVIHLHQRRMAMRSQVPEATSSRTLTAILAPCMPSEPANRSSSSGMGKGKRK